VGPKWPFIDRTKRDMINRVREQTRSKSDSSSLLRVIPSVPSETSHFPIRHFGSNQNFSYDGVHRIYGKINVQAYNKYWSMLAKRYFHVELHGGYFG